MDGARHLSCDGGDSGVHRPRVQHREAVRLQREVRHVLAGGRERL